MLCESGLKFGNHDPRPFVQISKDWESVLMVSGRGACKVVLTLLACVFSDLPILLLSKVSYDVQH